MYQYQKFWDRIANRYAKTPIKNQQAFADTLENIRKRLNENDAVLDFGCGTGTYSIAIADKVKSIDAIDISENMLSIARDRANNRNIGNINFEHLEIFDPKLQPETYSVVLAFNIMHLQQDPNKALSRIRTLLKPGGLLISKTACASEGFSLLAFFIKPFSKIGIIPHVSFFTFSQLQTLISNNQLKIIEAMENAKDSMEYFIVAQK